MPKLILESFGTYKGRILEGVALTPTISLNGNIYAAEEIDKARNLNVPLKADWEHTDEIIGNVVYTLDESNHRLLYRATITDDKRASEIKEGVHKVSIEANVDDVAESCTKARCYNLVQGLTMEGIGITATPGVQTTTLSIIESHQDWKPITDQHCEKCKLSNCSLSANIGHPVVMTDENKSETKVIESKVEEAHTCPEDQKVDGKCSEMEKKEQLYPSTANETPVWQPSIDEVNKNLKEFKEMLDTLKQRINNPAQLDELSAMENFNKNLYKKTRISPTGHSFAEKDLTHIAKEGVQALKKFGSYSFDIDLSPEYVREALNRKKVEEAISFSGDQANKINAMSDVFVLPGGKHLKTIRDLVRFKEFAPGQDMIKFFKGDIPNAGTITEGSATSASTHTVTTVTVEADTVTGVAQSVKQADIEDSPFEMFSYLAQTARAEVLEAEATLVFDTAAQAATPGLWINPETGATITTDDTSGITMEPLGVATALKHWETQGYDTSFGNAYIVMHPAQLRDLRTTSNLTTYIQQGDATIAKSGRLTHLYGVELIPSTAVKTFSAQTNTAYRAVGGIKGHTFILGSARELTVDLLKIPKESAYDWTWSQRKNSGTFDATSFVRLSSTTA